MPPPLPRCARGVPQAGSTQAGTLKPRSRDIYRRPPPLWGKECVMLQPEPNPNPNRTPTPTPNPDPNRSKLVVKYTFADYSTSKLLFVHGQIADRFSLFRERRRKMPVFGSGSVIFCEFHFCFPQPSPVPRVPR